MKAGIVSQALRVLIVAALAALAAAAPAAAARIEVTTLADEEFGFPSESGECSLREAMSAANSNLVAPGDNCVDGEDGHDEITFAPGLTGTINLTQGELGIVLDDLTITGPGRSKLTVSAANNAGPSRVLTIDDPSIDVLISGLSLVGGHDRTFGGGIYNKSDLTLRDVRVANNTATETGEVLANADGGGIYHSGNGTLTLDRSVVEDNVAHARTTAPPGPGSPRRATARGGGVLSDEGTLVISRSVIDQNQAVAQGSSQANAVGGGLQATHLEIDRTTISRNLALGENAVGGGIFASTSYPLLELSTVADNRSAIVGLSGSASGAGLYVDALGFTVRSSTIARNGPETGTGDGSNLYMTGSDRATIENTIISDPRGGGANCNTAQISTGFNVDYSPAGASCFSTSGSTDTTANPLLGPLAANGGLGLTLAPAPNSPAVDAGSNLNQTAAYLNQDQRGLRRPVNKDKPNAAGSNGTDIGALELQPTLPPRPTGKRAAALKKCKKIKRSTKKKTKKARKKCIAKAKKLPV